MIKTGKILTTLIIAWFLSVNFSDACTNFMVTKGASADGSTMITYNADAGGFMEPLYYLPAQDHDANDSVLVYDWDSGKYLGKIKQVSHTYRVVGNMNEHQVAIGETTYTGRKELKNPEGIIDYGSLMFLALQRAKTAREAIKVMVDLMEEYGYYSTGESFSVSDANEVWIFEVIGKGPGVKGANWVARLVPDGYVCAHANEARIRDFPTNSPNTCMYSKDIFKFAEEKGWYKPDSVKFSFTDIFAPDDPGSMLYCEGRVWALFNGCAPSLNLNKDYWRAVKGAEPYPLFIKPDKKLTVEDVIDLMRDHFEGTEWDMTKGLAAGPFGCPYRWKSLSWKIEGDTNHYGWNRPISTQQTAFAFVAQSRAYLPKEIGGVFWYGVDDNYSNVYVPLYTSMQEAPECFTVGSNKELNLNSAFWIFNLVANIAYSKYSFVIKDIQKEQKSLESYFHKNQADVEKAAMELYKMNKKLAVDYLSDYSIEQSKKTMKKWTELWKKLVVKYNDGYINDIEAPGNQNGRHPKSSYYGTEYQKQVIKERPGFYDVKWLEKKK